MKDTANGMRKAPIIKYFVHYPIVYLNFSFYIAFLCNALCFKYAFLILFISGFLYCVVLALPVKYLINYRN